MAEPIRLSEFVKLSNVGEGLAAMADRERSMIYLWDCGPAVPEAPRRPAVPKGKEGDPEFDVAMVDFRRDLLAYEEDLKTYSARKTEYAQFQTQWGGPYEVKMWSVDAQDALERDTRAVKEGRQPGKRWFISARTRGYDRLPNDGLPGNLKPGPGHFANLQRERDGEADIDAIKARDPIFGAQEMRS